MANDETTFTGFPELFEKLATLESLVQQRQILIRALRSGGPQLIADTAAQLAPVDTGNLAANMVVTVTQSTASESIAKIGPARSAFYGRFPEFGTSHMNKEAFLEPAFEARKQEAIEVTARALAELIEDAARK